MADAWDVVGEDAAPKRKPVDGGWTVVGEHGETAAPERSGQDYIFDLATRVRQGTRNVVGGLVGLPVDIANLATEAPRLALRGGNALREAVGLDALPVNIPALQQPEIVQGIRESGNITNDIDAAEHLSPKAQQQAQEFQSMDGLLASLGYLAKNPSYAGTEVAAQIPQFLQIAPGSTLGTIALQGASAASQNNQQIGDTMRAEGASEQDIADTLADAYAPSLIGNTLLPSVVPGGAAIERVLAGNAGKELLAAGGSRLRRALVDFLGETGTEGAQEGIDQIVQNLATGHPWNEQVGQNVALGAAIGAPGGLAAGTYEGVTAQERPEAEPAPSTNAIDPALLARGAAELQAANAPAPPSIADVVAPQAERPPTPAGSIDELVQRNLPEIAQAIQNNPDVPWAEAARALGLESAPEAQPPSRLPLAEPKGQNPQEIAARMRVEAQQRAAQEPARVPQQTTAPAVQPSVPATGSGRTGGDLAHAQDEAPPDYAPPERFGPLDLRHEIGWSQRGGLLQRAAPDDRTLNDEERAGIVAQPVGEVIGRTKWVGWPAPDGTESQFWRNRPDKSLSIAAAHAAMDKFERGKPLKPIEQRFIAHAESVARDYDRMTQDMIDEQNAEPEAARQQAIEDLRQQHAIDVADGDRSEALSLYELAHRAASAGVDDFDLAQATNEPDKAYAARLWGLISEAEQNGTEPRTAAEDRGRSDQGRESGQERAPAPEPFALDQQPAAEETRAAPQVVQPGLFAPPTTREQTVEAERRKDAERNGLGRDEVAPSRGGGELFAGPRPVQNDLQSTEAAELSPDDLSPSEREAFDRARNASEGRAASERQKQAIAERAQLDGERKADELGLREPVAKVLEGTGIAVHYLDHADGLHGLATPDYIALHQSQGEGKRVAGVYVPAQYSLNGEAFIAIYPRVASTPELAAFTAAHEVSGHHGLRTLLGDSLNPALDIADQNPTVKAVADSMMKQRGLGKEKRRLAVEEALADLGAAVRTGNFDRIKEKHGIEVPEGIRRERLREAIANFLRRLKALFAKRGVTFTDEQVRDLLDAADAAARGEGESGAPESALNNIEPAPQTDTPAFKRWFGDSKVVDADGKPLVVYHGTNADIDQFRHEMLGHATRAESAESGFFFVSRPDVATGYAHHAANIAPVQRLLAEADEHADREDWDAYDDAVRRAEELEAEINSGPDSRDRGQNIIPAYLSLQNPAEMDAGGESFVDNNSDINAFILRAKRDGHDGVIIRNLDDDPGRSDMVGDHYIAFRPEQIKSAIGNAGTFDPNNPSILASIEPSPDFLRTSTGESVVREGRLLSLIDAVKAAGGDLSALTEAVKNRDTDALHKAIDDLLPSLRPKPRVTGLKNAVTDAEREAAGRSPILADAIKSNESAVADALRALKADPNIGAETIAKLSRAGVEGITLADEAVLLVHKTDLLNKREAAAKKLADPGASEDAKAVARQAWEAAEAEIAALDIAAKNSGREWGRFGQFRQRMMREDFTLAALERKERARLERPLTQEESATIKAMADTIATLQKRVDDLQARVANSESEWAYEHMARRAPARGGSRAASLHRAADEARRRLRANQGVPSRRGQSGAIISPTVFYDLSVIGASNFVKGAQKLGDWVRAMRADVGDWFDGLKNDHDNLFAASKREAARHTADQFDVSPAEVLEGIDRENVTPKDVRKLIAAHVGAGLRGEQAVIGAAAKDLGLAEDEVRALFVQSVPRGAQSLTEAQQELSDLRKLVRLQAELDRLETGRPKPEAGKPREDSPAVAAKKAELADLRKRLRPVRDPEGRYQEMRGKQIARRIAELQARIEAGDFAKRPRVPRTLNEANQRAMYELDKAKEDFLRHQFEDTMRRRSPLAKVFGGVADTLNLARAVMTSFDLSAVLRQGGFIAYGHPLRAAKSIGPSLKSFWSEANEHKVNTEIANRKNAPLYKKYGLQLTGIGAGPLTQIEEAYASRWLSKLPWWSGGGLVRGSGRAYVAFINKLRADTFDAMAASLARKATPSDAEGKAIANYINVATGRGKAVGGEMAAQALNTVFFAPRLVASRFQLLAGQPLYGGSARTRKLVAQEYARFAIGVSLVLGLAAFGFGADEDDENEKPMIGLDPRSSDFLKIQIGDTYIDPMAGLAQVSVLLSRLATGETVTGAGAVKPLRTEYTLTDLRRALGEDIEPLKLGKDGNLPYGSRDAASIIGSFLRTKLAPVPGAIINTLAGTDVIGNRMTPAEAGQELVVPMSFQNIADIMEDNGIPKGTAIEVLGLLGMGIQYRAETNADKLADLNANVAAVQADVKDRLSKLPPDQWPQALADMKREYGPAMEGVELDTYKDDYTDKAGNFHDAGSPKVDKQGRPKLKSGRIADEATYRKNAQAPAGDQVHHLIPDNLVRHHPLMARARELGYDLDSADNLIAMPAKAGADAIAHNTDHPEYDAEVLGALNDAQRQLKREFGPLRDAPRDEVLDAIRKVEEQMRSRIQRKDVPTKDGRLAMLNAARAAAA